MSKNFSLMALLAVVTAICSFFAGFSVRQQTEDLAAQATIQNLNEQRELWEDERADLLKKIDSLSAQLSKVSVVSSSGDGDRSVQTEQMP